MTQKRADRSHVEFFAQEFNVCLLRELCANSAESRWLVSDASNDSRLQSDGNKVLTLFELVIMHEGESAERLAFTEILADEFDGPGALLDMHAEGDVGFAWLLQYEASVPLEHLAHEQKLSAGQLASIFIASLALSLRASNAGYCLGAPELSAFAVTNSGGIVLTDARGFHARQPHQRWCCQGQYNTESAQHLFDTVGESDAVQMFHEILQSLNEAPDGENLLEVGLELLKDVVTAQRLQLPDAPRVVTPWPLGETSEMSRAERTFVKTPTVLKFLNQPPWRNRFS